MATVLADLTAWVVHGRHRTAGQQVPAQAFAHLTWKADRRKPRTAAHVTLLAAPGDEAALRRAADVCDEALLSRDGSTFDGLTDLGASRAQLLGRLERRRLPPSGELTRTATPFPFAATTTRSPGVTGPRRFAL